MRVATRRSWPLFVVLPLLAQTIPAFAEEADPFTVDYSKMSWSDAFTALNHRLAKFYPFTESKRIDWNHQYATFAERIWRAESIGDPVAYYATLLDYAYSIPDGHIGLSGESERMWSVAHRAVASSFGLRLVELDDRRVLVSEVVAKGPADRAGIRVGANVLDWNGAPIDRAIDSVSIVWADAPPATPQGRRLEQLALLTRAPRRSRVTVTFQNPQQSVTMRAIVSRSSKRLLTDLSPFPSDRDLTIPIDYWVLPSGVGYLRIVSFDAATPKQELEFIATLREALSQFVADRVPGVIVDLRRNAGGLNRLVTKTAGFFYPRRKHFETVTAYDATADRFEINEDDPEARMYILPQRPRYGGPLAILVGHGCMSGAEGLALALRRLPNAKVVGIYSSHGSYGISSAEVKLPEGLKFEYPYGRSLDARGRLQIDSDYRGRGGVMPDIRVALDDAAFRAKYVDGRDIEIETAVAHLQTVAKKYNKRRPAIALK